VFLIILAKQSKVASGPMPPTRPMVFLLIIVALKKRMEDIPNLFVRDSELSNSEPHHIE
jgi:hypothetical protein